MARATKACRPLFESQLSAYQSLPAIAAGAAAGLAWSGKKRSIQGGKNVHRGFIRERLEGKPWILTWHPTYAIFKDKWRLGEFRADLARWSRIIRGETEAKPIWLPASDKNLRSLIEECRDLDVALGLDIETAPGPGLEDHTGKCTLRASLKTVGFGSPTRGISFLASDGSLHMRRTLTDPHIAKVWHNGIWFDGPVLRRHGYEVNNVSDTREKRYVLAPESKLSLGYLASLMTDFPPWKEVSGEGEDDSGKGHAKWESRDLDALREYNAYDCIVTARVDIALEKDLSEAE